MNTAPKFMPGDLVTWESKSLRKDAAPVMHRYMGTVIREHQDVRDADGYFVHVKPVRCFVYVFGYHTLGRHTPVFEVGASSSELSHLFNFGI